MQSYSTYDKTVDEVLGHSLDYLDIPPGVRRRAIARFEEVARWLSTYWLSRNGGDIYCQGSFRLNTVIRPTAVDGEYDMDLVCCLNLTRESVTQAQLKARVGEALSAYVATGPLGNPYLDEGGRCWTLVYPGEPFHMDVLPAIPDGPGTAISLTDRELRAWQSSDPIAYADWFRDVMAAEVVVLKEAARSLGVEPVPEDEIKTTLQRAVQALKRHRDEYFGDASKDAPASIIITTLAARAYEAGAYSDGALLHSVLAEITATMTDFVFREDGEYVIENPVCGDENFADRWNKHPQRAAGFFGWIEEARRDFSIFETNPGVPRLLESVGKSFGDGAKLAAAQRLGSAVRTRREAGLLTVGATGLVGAAGSRSVPDHTFHGDAPSSAAP